ATTIQTGAPAEIKFFIFSPPDFFRFPCRAPFAYPSPPPGQFFFCFALTPHRKPRSTSRFVTLTTKQYSYVSLERVNAQPSTLSSIAQLAEHSTVNRRVTGSSPVGGAGNHPATSTFGSGVIRLWFDTGHG